jgi:hypothetical protein
MGSKEIDGIALLWQSRVISLKGLFIGHLGV